jgi:drug/metabolite transporter (DMT)-like permease
MLWLLTASIVWGFSFGLIKGQTTGVDPFVLGAIRTTIAACFFLPWQFSSKRKTLPFSTMAQASLCGFIQIGLMYGPYLLSFKYLKSHEVALFTMTTPLLMAGLLALTTRKNIGRLAVAVLLATGGGMLVAWKDFGSPEIRLGLILVQFSNLLFAAGLILWKKWLSHESDRQLQLMFPYFFGAAFASLILALIFGHEFRVYSSHEWAVFLWLGAVASGLGSFFWNKGALKVSAPTLAVANNIKLPIAIVISIFVFGETVEWTRLAAGITILFIALRLATWRPQTK